MREELKRILENHNHWLNRDCEDWETMRADLRGANLRGADLHEANLRRADLRGADLSEADLRGANIYGADLSEANLSEANLRGADLSEADLRGADLSEADLRGADLSRANLRGADLSEADLRKADLRKADIYVADLRKANIYGADLRGAENVPFIPVVCPEIGDFIGFKKAGGKIIQLKIPADAKRSSATSRKCRCNKAFVIAITNLDGSPCDLEEVSSDRRTDFVYKVGEMVEEPKFCDDRWRECAEGIHFFMSRQEAKDY